MIKKSHFVIVRMAVTLHQKMWRKGSPLYQLIWKVEEDTNVPQKLKMKSPSVPGSPFLGVYLKKLQLES